MRDFTHLQAIPPELALRALRAGGMRKGNTIPGVIVLKDALCPAWSLGECAVLLQDLKELAEHLCVGTWDGTGIRGRINWMKYRIALGQLVHESHHGKDAGPCGCLWHGIWRQHLEDIYEALSEY